MARPRSVRAVARAEGRVALEIVMVEGRKREVRRMLAAVDLEVTRLVRVRIGPLRLGRLGPGAVRPLDPGEVRALLAAAAGPQASAGRGRRSSR